MARGRLAENLLLIRAFIYLRVWIKDSPKPRPDIQLSFTGGINFYHRTIVLTNKTMKKIL